MSQQHEWLKELNSRQQLSEQEAKEFYWKECGYEGERRFMEISQRESLSQWQWLFDLRLLTKAGEIQLDAVLICEVGVICFEVKNYRAAYHFLENKLTVNGTLQFHDAFRQVERSRSIFDKFSKQVIDASGVKYYVVFINEEDTVEIEPGVSDIPYIKNSKLLQFFRDLRDECERLGNLPQVFNREFHDEASQLKALHQQDHRRYSLTEERFSVMKKGIYCEKCRGFNIKNARYHMICEDCGFCESKEKTTLRLVCSLGILLPYQGLDPYKVYQLSGGALAYRTICYTMAKYLEKSQGQQHYRNTNLSFEEQFSHINFRYKDKPHFNKI